MSDVRIGVIGAGVMGSGIAQVLGDGGLPDRAAPTSTPAALERRAST